LFYFSAIPSLSNSNPFLASRLTAFARSQAPFALIAFMANGAFIGGLFAGLAVFASLRLCVKPDRPIRDNAPINHADVRAPIPRAGPRWCAFIYGRTFPRRELALKFNAALQGWQI
jgi:hypothetical protein